MQTENLRPSTTGRQMLITQGTARSFSLFILAHEEMHTSNIATTGGCWCLQSSQLQTRQNVFILEEKWQEGKLWGSEPMSKFQSSPSFNIKKISSRARWKGGDGEGEGVSRNFSQQRAGFSASA